jgi:pyruvate/2-oxoglutarate dehydrogenase complex dihydrolipoamide acyltransferase (E2) component
MPTPILLPDLGVPKATVSVWFVAVGDLVYEGDVVLEVEVPGATFGVAAPATGRLAELLVRPDDVLTAGQVVGMINTIDE